MRIGIMNGKLQPEVWFMGNLQTHPHAAGQTRGFTRAELLAVIAALTVVAGLVLPGLAVSNSGSSRAVCFNNMRQMGLAMGMYTGDYQDYLAFCNFDNGNAPEAGWLYGPGKPPYPPVAAYSTNYGSAWQEGLWFKYINDPNAYLCPVDIRQATYQQRGNQLCSYLMNASACMFDLNNLNSTCKISQIWSPACFLMWEPDCTSEGALEFNGGAIGPTAPPIGTERIGLLHTTTGGEVVRCDGGVEFITATNFASIASTAMGKGPGPNGATYLWWNPISGYGH